MMSDNSIPSKLLDDAVNEFSTLPGIGNKTALRLVLHLLKREKEDVMKFGNTIINMRENIKRCACCNNISDTEYCDICSDAERNKNIICVVESIKDVMAVERTKYYKGVYHVLGGIISPMEGIGPGDLDIKGLEQRARKEDTEEIILALNPTMEGDTTNFFLYRKLAPLKVKITTLARGVAVGNELEYTDEITLGRSLANRTLFSVMS